MENKQKIDKEKREKTLEKELKIIAWDQTVPNLSKEHQ